MVSWVAVWWFGSQENLDTILAGNTTDAPPLLFSYSDAVELYSTQ
jgi:hypothetical protein